MKMLTPVLALMLALAFSVAGQAAGKKAVAKAPIAHEVVEAQPVEELLPEAKLVVDPGSNTDAAAETIAGAKSSEAKSSEVSVPAAAVEAVPKPDTAKLPENQIPVLTGAKEAKKSEGSSWSRLLITLGVMVVALGAAIYGLKRWSSKGGRKGPNTRIKVIAQHPLGPKKNLTIIHVAGESILIGVTDHNITMIKSLALIDDEIPESVPNHFQVNEDEYDEMPVSRSQDRARRSVDSGEGEDFAMRALGDIRDTVSTRLKNMKNF